MIINITEHEKELIKSFVLKQKKNRYLKLISKPKLRKKFLDELYHFNDFDDRFVIQLSSDKQNLDYIYSKLLQRGALGSCFVFSVDPELDRQSLSLKVALNTVIGNNSGTIISCLPGELAYYEGETPGDRYILFSENYYYKSIVKDQFRFFLIMVIGGLISIFIKDFFQ